MLKNLRGCLDNFRDYSSLGGASRHLVRHVAYNVLILHKSVARILFHFHGGTVVFYLLSKLSFVEIIKVYVTQLFKRQTPAAGENYSKKAVIIIAYREGF